MGRTWHRGEDLGWDEAGGHPVNQGPGAQANIATQWRVNSPGFGLQPGLTLS